MSDLKKVKILTTVAMTITAINIVLTLVIIGVIIGAELR